MHFTAVISRTPVAASTFSVIHHKASIFLKSTQYRIKCGFRNLNRHSHILRDLISICAFLLLGDDRQNNRIQQGVPQGAAQNAAYSAPEKDGMPGWAIVLLVITSPVWLVMILVILSALLGIVAALFGIAIAVVAVMGALLICGVVLFGAGIGTAFAGNPAIGIGLMGGGLIVLAFGVLAVVLVVWIFGGFLPWALKGICKLCKKPFNKRKERAAA